MLRLLRPELQRQVTKAIMNYDRIPKAEAVALGKALGAELGLTGLGKETPAQDTLRPEMEHQLAWAKIKEAHYEANGRDGHRQCDSRPFEREV